MELRTPTYQQHLPTEESLWKNRGVGHRLWKAWSIGAITGAFTSAVVGYWYDYPVLTAKDGYKTAFMGSLKLTGKYALGFSAASLIFQATTEFVNAYQQKRTVLGPFLGGIASVLSIGLMSTLHSLFKSWVGYRNLECVFVCEKSRLPDPSNANYDLVSHLFLFP
jgi:hypothetical protein